MNANGYSAREEQRLLDALGRGLLKVFPNPERGGYPGVDVLKRIASRTMSIDEAEKWLDHLGSCSPAMATSLNFVELTNPDGSGRCWQSLRAFWLLLASAVGSCCKDITKVWLLKPLYWTYGIVLDRAGENQTQLNH